MDFFCSNWEGAYDLNMERNSGKYKNAEAVIARLFDDFVVEKHLGWSGTDEGIVCEKSEKVACESRA